VRVAPADAGLFGPGLRALGCRRACTLSPQSPYRRYASRGPTAIHYTNVTPLTALPRGRTFERPIHDIDRRTLTRRSWEPSWTKAWLGPIGLSRGTAHQARVGHGADDAEFGRPDNVACGVSSAATTITTTSWPFTNPLSHRKGGRPETAAVDDLLLPEVAHP
jgi:hypothetical protein